MKHPILTSLVFAAAVAHSASPSTDSQVITTAEERTLIGGFQLEDLDMDSDQIELHLVRIGDHGGEALVTVDLEFPFTKEQARMMQARIRKDKSGEGEDVLLKILALVEGDDSTKFTQGRIVAFRAKEGAGHKGPKPPRHRGYWPDEGFIRLDAEAKRSTKLKGTVLDNRELHRLRDDLGNGEAAYGIIGIEMKVKVQVHIRQDNTVFCTVQNPDSGRWTGCHTHVVSLPPEIAGTLEEDGEYIMEAVVAEDALCYGAFWVHARSLKKLPTAK